MSTKHTWGQALWTWGLVSWLAGAMAIGCGGGGEDPPTFATWSVTATPTAAARVEIGGEAYVSVPVGAVDEVTEIRIAEIALATPPAGAAMVSVPLRFEPEGKTFLQPVDIAITVSTSGLPAGSSIDDVVVLRAPAGTGQFVPIPTAVGSPTIVIAETDHFSDFVAVVWTGAVPACGNGTCAAGETCSSCPYDCGLCLAAPSSAELILGAWNFCTETQSGDPRPDAATACASPEPDVVVYAADGRVYFFNGTSCMNVGAYSVNGDVLTVTECEGFPSESTQVFDISFDGPSDEYIVYSYRTSVRYAVEKRVPAVPSACANPGPIDPGSCI